MADLNNTTNGTTTYSTKPSALPPPTNNFAKPNPLARTRPQTTAEEEAGTELKLGDFDGVQTLSTSEARVIMDAVFEQRRKRGQNVHETDVIIKMQEYMDMFARFKDREIMAELESLLKGQHFENFERSQLVNLIAGDADEAKTLIPSLSDKISDDQLADVLDAINERRRNY